MIPADDTPDRVVVVNDNNSDDDEAEDDLLPKRYDLKMFSNLWACKYTKEYSIHLKTLQCPFFIIRIPDLDHPKIQALPNPLLKSCNEVLHTFSYRLSIC